MKTRIVLFLILNTLMGISYSINAQTARVKQTTSKAKPSDGLPAADYIVDHSKSKYSQLRPLPFDAVQWTNGFWADHFKQLTDVTLDESWRLLADPNAGHVLDNLRNATKPGVGEYVGTTWHEEWLYKWIEAAACVWRVTRNPEVERRMNEAIAIIGAAQQPDGYLSAKKLVKKEPRFQDPKDHEIYNMGHLITAGVIHYRMTGKDTLLNIAKRSANFLCKTVGVTVKPYMAHNPSALMGLVELYRLTGEKKYMDCAQLIVDRRGENPKKQSMINFVPGYEGSDMIQDRVPVRKSTEVVGHNVFFTYLYTGAADLCAETGDQTLNSAITGLWDDLTLHKMFIHGGVSAQASGLSNNTHVAEAAGNPYELPNSSCYNETCGQIGTFMWAYRMLANHPDGQYADVMEREMYNGFLPAMSLDGKLWFYRNILRRYEEDYKVKGGTDMNNRQSLGRKQICCPSNLLRTIAQLSAYFYSLDDSGVWVHQYGGNKLNCKLATGEAFSLEQITNYPWSGDIEVVVRKAPSKSVAIRLRVPNWASKGSFAINGKQLTNAPVEHGYVTIVQNWKSGDKITINFPLESTLMTADPRVEETRNQVAVMRGPVLYCLESPDLPSGYDVPSVFIPSNSTFKPVLGMSGINNEISNQTFSLQGTGIFKYDALKAPLYRPFNQEAGKSFDLTLIPYYAWANRSKKTTMSVWLPIVVKE